MHKSIILKLLFLSFVLFLSCNKSDYKSDLYGEDKNKNSVRDDVEHWVAENFQDPNIRNALFERAKAFERFLNVRDASSALAAQENRRKSFVCLLYVSSVQVSDRTLSSDRLGKLEEIIFNTPLRKEVYETNLHKIPRGVYTTGYENPYELFNSCLFEVQNEKEMILQMIERKILNNKELEIANLKLESFRKKEKSLN
jgi:hypothetical protein